MNRDERLAALPAQAREWLRQSAQALQQGQRTHALQFAQQVVRAHPDHADALRQLASALAANGRAQEALAVIDPVVARYPDDPELLNTQAIVLETAGHNERALAAFRRVCELQPASAVHAYNLGRALSNRGDSAGSLAELERTLAIDPEHRNARATLAEVLRRLGRTEEAVTHLRVLLGRNPDDVKAWSALAALNVAEFDDADIATMERLRARPGLSADEQVLLAYGLGKAHAAHARYDKAYAAYVQAKSIVHARQPWNAAAHAAAVDAILATFAQAAPAGSDDRRGAGMIFIVSLPRSGSTLTEQILAAHPQVDAGEERTDLLDTIMAENQRRGQLVEKWAGLATPDDWRRLGEDYLERSRRWRGTGTHATDKAPGNWVWLGALFAMLPGARVIDCRRDPLETAWSCFTHLFKIGAQNFSHDFASIGAYARDHDRAMRHWLALYPQRIRTQRYEALVADPETQIRELLDFCGLPFDPACLRPHEVERSIRTASASQVREPIRRDTARTDKYGALLDPLRKELGLPPFAA
jgi:tetratricopeptide (TPR) repeat protein